MRRAAIVRASSWDELPLYELPQLQFSMSCRCTSCRCTSLCWTNKILSVIYLSCLLHHYIHTYVGKYIWMDDPNTRSKITDQQIIVRLKDLYAHRYCVKKNYFTTNVTKYIPTYAIKRHNECLECTWHCNALPTTFCLGGIRTHFFRGPIRQNKFELHSAKFF
jgi:hypothetical protein